MHSFYEAIQIFISHLIFYNLRKLVIILSEDTQYNDLIEHFRNWIIRLPESEHMMPLLKLRFTPEEAEFLAKIPFLGHTAEQLSARLDMPIKKLMKKLNKFAKNGIVFRSVGRSEVRYSLRDSLFVFYRSIGWTGKKNKLNRKISPLLNQYYIETYAEEFVGHETQGLRAIPINKTINDTRQVMPYEDILKVLITLNITQYLHAPVAIDIISMIILMIASTT